MAKKSVVTIGFFDGVHAGHRKLIETAVSEAKKKGLLAVLITFDRHPHKRELLTPLKEKLDILGTFGLDEIDTIEFTPDFARMPAQKFIDTYLFAKHNMDRAVIGHDFRFGLGRKGNKEMLEKSCEARGCSVNCLEPVTAGDKKTVVSSSLIRTCLSIGEIKQANKLLCRDYSVEGKIIKGAGIGSSLGFPTANIQVPKEKLLPAGVYSGFSLVNGSLRVSAANIGFNPTVTGKKELKCEVHVIDYDGIIKPGDNMIFYFREKIRNEKKFPNRGALAKQIKNDVEKIKKSYRAAYRARLIKQSSLANVSSRVFLAISNKSNPGCCMGF